MSKRDHYKGVPKTRNAVVRSDGSIAPLDKANQDLANTKLASPTVEQGNWLNTVVLYARTTGDDSTGDGTLENPYRTFVRCTKDIPIVTDGSSLFIDITDLGLEVVDGPLDLPPLRGYRTRSAVSNGETIRSDYRWVRPLNIVASPTVIQTFTPSNTTSATTSGRKSHTLTGAGWVPDEHKGKFIIGTGPLSSSVIVGNTEDTITIATETALTAPLSIVQPSATLRCGYSTPPAGVLVSQAFNTGAVETSFSVVGVAFESNSSVQSVRAYSGDDNYFELCSFQGISVGGKSGLLSFIGCYFNSDTVDWELGTMSFEGCFFDNTNIAKHSAGENKYFGCTLLGTPPLGSDTVYNRDRPHPNIYIETSTIVSGTGNGVVAFGTARSLVAETTIDYCVGDAIYIDRGARVIIKDVTGADNGGYGVLVNNGSQAEIRNGAVTGALGDLKVGTLLSPSTWADFVSFGGQMLDLNTVSGTLSRMFSV